ncbi:MAG: UDP-N-acetylmuramate dehydrogenase [Candidatus Saccharimonadales bacterium]
MVRSQRHNCKPRGTDSAHSCAQGSVLCALWLLWLREQGRMRYTGGMKLMQNVSLADYSSMQLGGTAQYVIEAMSHDELIEALEFAKKHDLPVRMIGGGSNIIWRDEGFAGVLLLSSIKCFEKIAEDATSATYKVGAGEILDDIISRTTKFGLSGIEALSLIPGTVGATPVQNVEAYGQEISQTLVELEAYDSQSGEFVTLQNSECDFSYRSSRFKTYDNGRFFITYLTLRLRKNHLQPPYHQGLQTYVDQWGKTDYSPAALREYVIDIRSQKLPDPSKVANNGSFFNNAIIPREQFDALYAEYPDIQHYPMPDGQVKIPARWLIENSGFSAGFQDAATGCGLWPGQALVVVNYTAKSTQDLETFAKMITDAVHAKFGISLKQEPELLP